MKKVLLLLIIPFLSFSQCIDGDFDNDGICDEVDDCVGTWIEDVETGSCNMFDDESTCISFGCSWTNEYTGVWLWEDVCGWGNQTYEIDNSYCDEEDIPNLTYVPDDSFEQYFINIGIDDVLDDYILTDMASEVTQMLVSNLGIEDLTGIEDCINIVYLDCSANNLLELNVANNIALDQLHCYSNNLTELNIQNNTNLKVLTCSFNSLSTLDISNNTLLTSLACSDNMISELDISSQIDLEYLDCHQNNLSELDIANNAELETLTCSFNNLSELNVITNTDLNQLALENNNILELDVTNNAELYYLDCSFNDIVELDISNNTDLNNMLCNNNDLSCIQVWDLNYAETYFIKDDDAIWSLDCEYGIGLEQNSKNKTLLKYTDLLGRLSTTKGFTLKMYDDGSIEKKYLIK